MPADRPIPDATAGVPIRPLTPMPRLFRALLTAFGLWLGFLVILSVIAVQR